MGPGFWTEDPSHQAAAGQGDSGGCSTLAGLAVPFADTLGVTATRGMGAALIATGIALAVITRRR